MRDVVLRAVIGMVVIIDDIALMPAGCEQHAAADVVHRRPFLVGLHGAQFERHGSLLQGRPLTPELAQKLLRTAGDCAQVAADGDEAEITIEQGPGGGSIEIEHAGRLASGENRLAGLEYQPADVEFVASASPPDDIQIYRSFRYGKHVEIILTDQRSYRDDHVVPEGANPNDRPPGAPDTVPTYAAVGKTPIFNNSEVFSRNFVLKDGFDQIEAFVQPTMDGHDLARVRP